MTRFLHPRVTAPMLAIEGISMLTILIYVADLVRRTWRKLVRGFTILSQSFHEAQEIRRTHPRSFMTE